MTNPMPAIFFGHGNPMNALVHNAWTDGWAAIGKEIPRPTAVLWVSAHWYLPATLVTASPRRGLFTTSAASRANCTRSSILRPATRSWRGASRICSRRSGRPGRSVGP